MEGSSGTIAEKPLFIASDNSLIIVKDKSQPIKGLFEDEEGKRAIGVYQNDKRTFSGTGVLAKPVKYKEVGIKIRVKS